MLQLVVKLRALAEEMFDVAAELEYYGGFNMQMHEKSVEMAGAAHVAQQWAEEIEALNHAQENTHGMQTSFPAV